MKTVITAIDNEKIYKELKENKNIKIIGKDLIYKEAVLEILEKNKKIDYIILYEKILGEINFFELIKKIKKLNNKIKIIIILENKNEKLEKNIKKFNIKNIYLKNKINSKKLIEIIIEKKEKNKKIINNKNNKIINNIKKEEIKSKTNTLDKFKTLGKKIKEKINRKEYSKKKIKDTKKQNDKCKHNEKNEKEEIIILGNIKNDVKLISLLLDNKIKKQNSKIATIDLDINNIKFYKNNKLNKKEILINNELKKYKKEKSKLNILQLKKIKNKNQKNNKRKNKNIKKINKEEKTKNGINKNIEIKKQNKKIEEKINKNKKIKNKISKNKKIKKYKIKINKNNYNTFFNNKKNKIINNLKIILSKKINNKITYFSNFYLILKNEKIKSKKEKNIIIEKIVEKIEIEFDYTIIKIKKIVNSKINEKLISNANKIVIIVKTNYLGVQEGKEIIEKIKQVYPNNQKSLHIVLEKTKKDNISSLILKEIFKNFKIIFNKKIL